MLGSKSAKHTIEQLVLFSVLGGCFAALSVACILWVSGSISTAPISTTLYLLLAVFGLSSVIVFAAACVHESFLRP